MRAGQLLGILASVTIIVLWVALMTTRPGDYPRFFVIAWGSIAVAAVSGIGAISSRPVLLYFGFALSLPMALFFLGSVGGIYRAIGFATPLLFLSGLVIQLLRRSGDTREAKIAR